MDLDLGIDAHVHTAFGAGRDSVGELVRAAERIGLAALTFADRAGPESAWLPAYEEAIRRAQRRTEVRLDVAVEVEIVGADGWLAFPSEIRGLDSVCVAMHRLPYKEKLVDPAGLRRLLDAKELRPNDAAEIVVGATIGALDRAGRYAPTRLARPLDLLARAGLDEAGAPPALLDDLARACRDQRVPVEVSEAWQRPSVGLAQRLAADGVEFVAASDAYDADHVGRWRYAARLAGLESAEIPVPQD